MNPRSSILTHPSGFELKTPLLIPSFSSKGFRFIKRRNKISSEASEFLLTSAEALYETVLISAYDLHHYFPEPKKLIKSQFNPQFVFIDSGGYETLEGYDLSETYKYPVDIKEWNLELLKSTLNKWPSQISTIFISYDNGKDKSMPLSNQIKRAEIFFANYPNQLHDFLIKPTKKGTFIDTNEITRHISLLKGFHIIGFTEKELGDSIYERMRSISIIREALDNNKINSPLHIFGSLDPLTSVLYFLSGAEIFDGLTWLKYSYYKGSAIYNQNFDIIQGRIKEKDNRNKKMMFYENIIYLRNLQSEMKTFLKDYNGGNTKDAYAAFKYNSDIIKDHFHTLKSN